MGDPGNLDDVCCYCCVSQFHNRTFQVWGPQWTEGRKFDVSSSVGLSSFQRLHCLLPPFFLSLAGSAPTPQDPAAA